MPTVAAARLVACAVIMSLLRRVACACAPRYFAPPPCSVAPSWRLFSTTTTNEPGESLDNGKAEAKTEPEQPGTKIGAEQPGTKIGPEQSETGSSAADSAEVGEQQLKERLLVKALDHVNQKGWTKDALRAAAQDLGYSPMFAALCSKGESELVHHFVQRSNSSLLQRLELLDEAERQRPLADRIKQAIKWRLEMHAPYIGVWPQAMAILLHPENAATSLSHMYALIDGIWSAVGDESMGYDWYTKRLVLQGVYTTTELYMVADFSPGHKDTWAALDRRMQDVTFLASTTKEMEVAAMDFVNRLRLFRSVK